jgi:hypothetical protein
MHRLIDRNVGAATDDILVLGAPLVAILWKVE